LHKGSFSDPRATTIIDDAKVWLEQSQEKFDIMIFDLSDPIEGGPAKMLYTRKFYEMVLTKLNQGGMFVTQSGPAGILSHKQVFTAINKTLSCVFPSTFAYTSHVPSFMDAWGFNMATSTPYDISALNEHEVDKRIKVWIFYYAFLHQTRERDQLHSKLTLSNRKD
jgi:thermospermine synthase